MKFWGALLLLGAFCVPTLSTAYELTQLTTFNNSEAWGQSIAADGKTVVYVSGPPFDPVYGQLNPTNQVYSIDRDSGTTRQLTTFPPAVGIRARVARLGGTVLIDSNADLFGENPDGSNELFTVRTDGSSFTQLTRSTSSSYAPNRSYIQADGKRVAFVASQDYLLQGGVENGEKMYLIDSDGTTLRRLGNKSNSQYLSNFAVAPDGSALIYQYNPNNPVPISSWEMRMISLISGEDTLVTLTNGLVGRSISDGGRVIAIEDKESPDSSLRIYLIEFSATGVPQRTPITPAGGFVANTVYVSHYSFYPQLTPDGRRVFFISNIDPGGKNPDHYLQLFYADVKDRKVHQITDFAVADIFVNYQVSDDGGIAVVVRGDRETPMRTLHAFDVATGGHVLLGKTNTGPYNAEPVAAMSADGDTAVFSSDMDPLGTNRNNLRQLFLVTGLRGEDGVPAEPSGSGGKGALGAYEVVCLFLALILPWIRFAARGGLVMFRTATRR